MAYHFCAINRLKSDLTPSFVPRTIYTVEVLMILDSATFQLAFFGFLAVAMFVSACLLSKRLRKRLLIIGLAVGGLAVLIAFPQFCYLLVLLYALDICLRMVVRGYVR